MKSTTKTSQSLIDFYRKSKVFYALDAIIIALLVVAILLSCAFTFKGEGHHAVVYHQGTVIGRYSLEKKAIVNLLDSKMQLVIEDGKVYVSASECPTHICVKSGKINIVGERIVCTPNKVTITIEGNNADTIVTGGAYENQR